MTFTDYLFFPFLAALFLIYFLFPIAKRWYVLLAGSVLFYAFSGIEMLPFAAGAVIVSWAAGCLMDRIYAGADERLKADADAGKEGKARIRKEAKDRCRLIFWIAVAMIFGVLIYTKTQRLAADIPGIRRAVWFFSRVYQRICRWGLKLPFIRLFIRDTKAAATRIGYSYFVPLGISYYSMSLVGYLADVYWKKEKPERNILKLALFTLWFPKILEGPIAKHRELAAGLTEGHAFEWTAFCHGMQRMLWGLFKKLCIADRLAMMVTPVFNAPEQYGGSVLLVAGLFSVFQLYCDFSGCMDIALGISESLGIRMTENFSRPFHAVSAAEFWRRWHISLGAWFRDYVYMPLVIAPPVIKFSAFIKKRFGKRAGKAVMSIVPLAAVWTLTALWHGTGWNYMRWGLYWGLLIIISNVFEPEIKKLGGLLRTDGKSAGYVLFRKVRTFFLFAFGRIIVLSGTLAGLRMILGKILFRFEAWHLLDRSMYSYGMDRQDLQLVMILIVFLVWIEAKQEKGVVFRERIDALPVPARWILYFVAIFFVLVFGIYGPGYEAASFVYMGF